jgi:hypothetical protein
MRYVLWSCILLHEVCPLELYSPAWCVLWSCSLLHEGCPLELYYTA